MFLFIYIYVYVHELPYTISFISVYALIQPLKTDPISPMADIRCLSKKNENLHIGNTAQKQYLSILLNLHSLFNMFFSVNLRFLLLEIVQTYCSITVVNVHAF
mgnify:CR=1 FL=1